MFSLSLVLMLAAQAPTPPAAEPAKPKKICRTVMTSESRLGTRTCKTASEWATHDKDGIAKLEAINRKNNE